MDDESGELMELMEEVPLKELGDTKLGGVMDDESGELMELMEEVPLKELGDTKLERSVRG